MYAKHKWVSDQFIAQRRITARTDTWVLFMKKKITEEEYLTISRMISSEDVENLVVAIELIKAKFKKPKKNKDGNKS